MPEAVSRGAWPTATHLVARWLEHHDRIDTLIESMARTLPAAERARCQHLIFGVVRNFGRINAALTGLVARPPRSVTRAVLFVAGYELIEASNASEAGTTAKIIHHAVEQTKSLASPAEARLVNAVGRKLAASLVASPPPKLAPAEILANYFSHPLWLVQRWLAQFGADATRQLLEWNQKPATIFARWRVEEPPPDFLRPTVWPNFFEVPNGRWSEVEALLKTGKLYLQDPATRLSVELLAPQAGETVLDLCAAPGGKSVLIADTMKTGKVVAVDLPESADRPGPRIERLKENLARVRGVEVALIQANVLEDLGHQLHANHALPENFSAVLLDVPCSNTGVMRHRADVRWRLDPRDFSKHASQQLALLQAASRRVRAGGRLVYSTCSIDAEENERVVESFLGSGAGKSFRLAQSNVSFPWTTGHDGAVAYLLKKQDLNE